MLLRHEQLTISGYFDPAGEYSYTMPLLRQVIPAPLWDLVAPTAVVSGLLMAGELTANWRRAEPILTVFTGLAYLFVVFLAVGSLPLISRYLLPMMPGFAALVLIGPRNRLRAASTPPTALLSRTLAAGSLMALVLLAAISAMLALNAFSFDHARRAEASKLVASGIRPDRIDAGPEWDGWHSAHGQRVYAGASRARGYVGLAPERYPQPPCTVMSASPLPPGSSPLERGRSTLVAKQPYHTFLLTGESYLYVYDRHASGCPLITGHSG
jgi:hypothetical protein